MNSEVNFPFWNLMIPDFPRKIVKFSSRNLVFLFNSFFNNSTVFTVDFFKTKTVEFNRKTVEKKPMVVTFMIRVHEKAKTV